MLGSKINIIYKSENNMFVVFQEPIKIPNVISIDDGNIPNMPWNQVSVVANICDHNYIKIIEQTRSSDEMVTIFHKCTKCFHVR
jgi:DNA-directed RNA polymerase subunit M/transcription elongation factor TFIIS